MHKYLHVHKEEVSVW